MTDRKPYTPPELTRLARVLKTGEIGKLIGRDAQWVRRLLVREGIGQKSGSDYLVTKTEFRAALPAIASEIEIAAAEAGVAW